MVYDNTQCSNPRLTTGERGFAIHDNGGLNLDEHRYELYTDDGRGNGDYICGSSDIYWIRRIAYSLDEVSRDNFDVNGVRK